MVFVSAWCPLPILIRCTFFLLRSGYVIDLFVERERKRALLCFSHAFRPSLKTLALQQMLAFEDLEGTIEFLDEMEAVFVAEDKSDVDTAKTYPVVLAASTASGAAGGVAAWAR